MNHILAATLLRVWKFLGTTVISLDLKSSTLMWPRSVLFKLSWHRNSLGIPLKGRFWCTRPGLGTEPPFLTSFQVMLGSCHRTYVWSQNHPGRWYTFISISILGQMDTPLLTSYWIHPLWGISDSCYLLQQTSVFETITANQGILEGSRIGSKLSSLWLAAFCRL